MAAVGGLIPQGVCLLILVMAVMVGQITQPQATAQHTAVALELVTAVTPTAASAQLEFGM